MRALVMVAIVTGCAGNPRLDEVETRLSAIESVQAKNQAATAAELHKVQVQLDALLFALRNAPTGDGGGDPDLEAKIDDLARQVHQLGEAIARLGDAAPAAARQRKRRPEPDPADVMAVPLGKSPIDGPADALVTIVRGYEYACPFCEKSRATMAELRKLYPDEVRIVYRHFVIHPATATLPAQAACAAQIQGKFFEYDELLWAKAFNANRDFSQANLEKLAVDAGLDLGIFIADLNGTCVGRVQDDMADLKKVGQGATPTFFVNGRYLAGAQSLATFTKLVDEELALARKRVKKGTKRSRYYKKWVLGKGKQELVPPANP
jgi:protein-disulfide isomerase